MLQEFVTFRFPEIKFRLQIPGTTVIFVSCMHQTLNPKGTKLFNLNFQSLEVVSRSRDSQLQVTEKLNPNIYQCFKIEGIL